MNKPLKWGLGFLFGVLTGNFVWLYGLESPTAGFFTTGWWDVWSAAYCVAIVAILFGLVRLVMSSGRTAESD